MSSKATTLQEPAGGWLDRLLRRQLFDQLQHLRECELVVTENGTDLRFGDGASDLEVLKARVKIDSPDFYRFITLGGSVGAAEAYMLGLWECDDLTSLIRILVRNREVLDGMESGLAWISRPALKWIHRRNRNSRSGSRRNIAAHYDLGNEFFKLFLDDNLLYSSAVFRDEAMSLEQASQHKLDRICQKLQLSADDHVLEIGTGWGGFALHAASRYGCRITTTTISREQFDLASQRVRNAGLEDRITVLQNDYRDLEGRFDKLVSIEMVEAVGHQFLDHFMARCSTLLHPGGMMLLQAITIEDHRFQQALDDVDFIQRFIFPGSFIPSVSAITGAMARTTDLRLFHLEDIGPSYARTLREWRRRFEDHIDQLREQGYPETFERMWRYYLHYCEGGFLERSIGSVQMLLTKPRCRRAELLPELK